MDNKPTRPLCLELEDARKELYTLVNNLSTVRQIPFYLLESIVADIYRDVKELSNTERIKATERYKQQMEEYQKGKE
jgi:hypothetical protein